MDGRDALSGAALDGEREVDRVHLEGRGFRKKAEILSAVEGWRKGARDGKGTVDDRPHHTHQTMENQTSFDLNEAVHSWRQSLAASPSLTPENVDELESHLRDGVEKLQPIGLSPAEAFMVARSRIGSADKLEAEFGKANPERLWVNRIKWMMVGLVMWNVLRELWNFVLTALISLLYVASSFFED